MKGDPLSLAAAGPVQETVIESLSEIVFVTDELLDVLQHDAPRSLWWLTPQVEQFYDDVNGLLKKLADKS